MARYASVVVEVEPDHLDRPFDYLVPEEHADDVAVGTRVEVVFAGRRVRGLVVATPDSTEVPQGRLRPLRRPLGTHRWADADDIEVYRWAARRFAAPVAAVVRHALPGRVVDVERRAETAGWFPPGSAERPAAPAAIPTEEAAWEPYGADGAWLRGSAADGAGAAYFRPLPGEDLGRRIVELAAATLAAHRDVLLVVPEPVSAAADAVVDAFGDLVVDVRDDPSPRVAYRGWLRARSGAARVVIGERRVAFWPLERLGLGIVLDESNPALKERRAPRHHAREVVLERARRARALGVLVGTVPSAIAWRLLAERRLRSVVPATDPERAAAPVVRVDDRSGPRARGRLGGIAVDALREAVEEGRLGVLLAARRGEGRALVCTDCGRRAACPRCASSLAVDPSSTGTAASGAFCEGCGWAPPSGPLRCEECGSSAFVPLAAGARRLGAELTRMLPDAEVAVVEGYAQPIPAAPAIVVLTRGSTQAEAPGPVGAVVLPDVDGQLKRPTLDAAEDTLRLSMRVAAWAAAGPGAPAPEGGATRRGATVVVQTREPEHHAVQALVRWDPGGFWREEVGRRAELRFPPVAHAVRIDAGGDGVRVGDDLRAELPDGDEVLGPRPVGERAALLVKSAGRVETLEALAPLRATWSEDGLDVRVDVDPVDVA